MTKKYVSGEMLSLLRSGYRARLFLKLVASSIRRLTCVRLVSGGTFRFRCLEDSFEIVHRIDQLFVGSWFATTSF